jgi:hypothetical protein
MVKRNLKNQQSPIQTVLPQKKIESRGEIKARRQVASEQRIAARHVRQRSSPGVDG